MCQKYNLKICKNLDRLWKKMAKNLIACGKILNLDFIKKIESSGKGEERHSELF